MPAQQGDHKDTPLHSEKIRLRELTKRGREKEGSERAFGPFPCKIRKGREVFSDRQRGPVAQPVRAFL